MQQSRRFLTQNLNFPIVFRFMGWLLMIEGAFMGLPAIVSAIYGESDVAMSFVYSLAITMGVGGLMTFGIRPSSMKLEN